MDPEANPVRVLLLLRQQLKTNVSADDFVIGERLEAVESIRRATWHQIPLNGPT